MKPGSLSASETPHTPSQSHSCSSNSATAQKDNDKKLLTPPRPPLNSAPPQDTSFSTFLKNAPSPPSPQPPHSHKQSPESLLKPHPSNTPAHKPLNSSPYALCNAEYLSPAKLPPPPALNQDSHQLSLILPSLNPDFP